VSLVSPTLGPDVVGGSAELLQVNRGMATVSDCVVYYLCLLIILHSTLQNER